MGTSLENTKITMNRYKKKRDFFLSFWLISLLVLVILFFVLLELIDFSILLSIYFAVLIIASIVFFSTRSRFLFYDMHYQYLRMILDDQKAIKIKQKIYTQSWLDQFEKDEFIKICDEIKYNIYYRYRRSDKEFGYMSKLLLIIIVAKSNDVDFYSDEIDNHIQSIMLNNNQASKATKQIVLQFKKYTNYNQSIKEKLDEIICYSMRVQSLIHINVGYFTQTNSVYYLRPLKRYPNKAYYVACQYINKYIGELS